MDICGRIDNFSLQTFYISSVAFFIDMQLHYLKVGEPSFLFYT